MASHGHQTHLENAFVAARPPTVASVESVDVVVKDEVTGVETGEEIDRVTIGVENAEESGAEIVVAIFGAREVLVNATVYGWAG